MPQILFSIQVGENLDPRNAAEPTVVLDQHGLITLDDAGALRVSYIEDKAKDLLESLWHGIQAHLDFGGGYDNLKQQLELARKHAKETG